MAFTIIPNEFPVNGSKYFFAFAVEQPDSIPIVISFDGFNHTEIGS